jgi:hypothetical protein
MSRPESDDKVVRQVLTDREAGCESRRPYHTPAVTVLGGIEDVTLGTSGAAGDAGGGSMGT